jgi:hypothetical protein
MLVTAANLILVMTSITLANAATLEGEERREGN